MRKKRVKPYSTDIAINKVHFSCQRRELHGSYFLNKSVAHLWTGKLVSKVWRWTYLKRKSWFLETNRLSETCSNFAITSIRIHRRKRSTEVLLFISARQSRSRCWFTDTTRCIETQRITSWPRTVEEREQHLQRAAGILTGKTGKQLDRATPTNRQLGQSFCI